MARPVAEALFGSTGTTGTLSVDADALAPPPRQAGAAARTSARSRARAPLRWGNGLRLEVARNRRPEVREGRPQVGIRRTVHAVGQRIVRRMVESGQERV